MSWTDERIERLKQMWHDGATASQIADELGGVSRNAVIGKAHRLGLEQRPSPVKPGEEKEMKKAAPAASLRPRLPECLRSALRRRTCNIARSDLAASSAKAPVSNRRRSPRPRRAGSFRPSQARRSPTRRAYSN